MATVLITGATSGIGLEIAKLYAQRGDRLILVGRRAVTDLDRHFFTDERYVQVDLAQDNAPQIIADFLQAQQINRLDLLIHNAGTGYYGEISEQTVASIQQVVDVNLIAPVALTHCLYPTIAPAKGKIILISSVVANLPTPDYAVYAATKAGLDEFGDNLRIEAKADDVTVQVIHPGATRTDMHRKLGIPQERMDTSKFPSAESVAQQIMNAIDNDKMQETIGFTNQLVRFAGKHFAGLIDFAMKRSRA